MYNRGRQHRKYGSDGVGQHPWRLITTAVFVVLVLVFDWRIGLIVLAGIVLYLCVVFAMEKKSAVIANDTQRSQTAPIAAVLETVQGMSVVKSLI